MWTSILLFVLGYLFLVFVALRLVVPFMGFRRWTTPTYIPLSITAEAQGLVTKHPDPSSFLLAAYESISQRWWAGRLQTVRYAPLAFRTNMERVWNTPGYAHCNTQNYLLYLLLLASKLFSPADIRVRTVFFNFFIHQYLQVRVNGQWVDADPAGAAIRGLALGTHISVFG